MKVVLASQSGACYGVNRALELALGAADRDDGGPVHTLGPLIHNPKVVSELQSRGVDVAENVEDVGCGTLVIRSHGVPLGVIASARREGLDVVDATCPHVKRAQEEASRLASEGRHVLILGEPGHPEVEAILSYSGQNANVIEDVSDVPDIPAITPIGVVVQTTQRREKLVALDKELRSRFEDIEVSDTICAATQLRQDAAMKLAATVDAMVVIGGRNSGNTRRLFEICCEACPRTFLVESADELHPSLFEGCSTVGVTAGASTPRPHIDAVLRVLEGF